VIVPSGFQVEGELGDIMNQISSEVQTLLLQQIETVENSPIGSYVPDIIQGVDYTDFLKYIRIKI